MSDLAKELRTKGATAHEVELAIADKLYLKQQGLDNKAEGTLQRLVNEAFQSIYNRPPTDAENREWMGKAREWAKDPEKSAKQVGYDIKDNLALKSQGLDKTDDAAIHRWFDEALAKVFEGEGGPSRRERESWYNFAKELVAKKTEPKDIRLAIIDSLRISQQNA